MASEWLKCRYCEASSEGPKEKGVKFTILKDELQHQFPMEAFNDRKVSQAIAQAFTNSQSRKSGSAHNRYIYGIETKAVDLDTKHPLAQENKQLQKQVQELQRRVLELEQFQVAGQQKLDDQMQCLLHPSNVVFHGPDTVEHFDNFSIDNILSELKVKAPDVVDLFQTLSRCNQTDEEDYQKLVQLRMITSLCTSQGSHTWSPAFAHLRAYCK